MLLQVLDIAFLVPVCIIFLKQGFWPLVYARAIVRLDLIIPEAIFIFLICGVTPKDTLKVMLHPIIATGAMTVVILLIKDIFGGMIWGFATIFISIIVYLSILFMFKEERDRYLYPALHKLKLM